MRIAYLASQVTLPGPGRRADAIEHDQMMAALRPAAAAAGAVIDDVAWDADVVWSAYDAAIIGTTWDYWDQVERFVSTLDRIGAACRLFNPAPLVRWNLHKGYLRDLAERGAPTIPTVWADQVDEAVVAEAFTRFETDRLVVKRQVGAGADGQVRLERGERVPTLPHPMMLQPFLPGIVEEGELSLVFVDGALSHGLRKRPAAGDYRIQSLYGGVEEPYEPTEADVSVARTVLDALDETPLYARVDLVQGPDGGRCLMELELVEPFLYPIQGPDLGRRLMEATLRRLG